MNERIKKLKDQCWVEKHWDNDMWIGKHIDLEKFAELIVAEVITALQKRCMGDNNREDMEVLRCVADMKKLFGVKE